MRYSLVPTSLQDDDVVRITRWDFARARNRLASARMAVFRRARRDRACVFMMAKRSQS